MNLRYTTKKKVRGVKRKSKQMVQNIKLLTNTYPKTDLDYGYWHIHLPIAQTFIDSSKTPSHVRQLCIQTLIHGVENLINLKPKLNISSRVVASISLPHLWHSQIIVFFGDEYFSNFFERNNDYQKWTPLPKNRNLITEWDLDLPDNLRIKGYKEEIKDEDYASTGELWFIGELD